MSYTDFLSVEVMSVKLANVETKLHWLSRNIFVSESGVTYLNFLIRIRFIFFLKDIGQNLFKIIHFYVFLPLSFLYSLSVLYHCTHFLNLYVSLFASHSLPRSLALSLSVFLLLFLSLSLSLFVSVSLSLSLCPPFSLYLSLYTLHLQLLKSSMLTLCR